MTGNPVAHSRSPVLHNQAFAQAGLNNIYVPLLVDNLPRFLHMYSSNDFTGFSVTIPHKVWSAVLLAAATQALH